VFEVIVHLEEASSLETRDNQAALKGFLHNRVALHSAFLDRVSAIDAIYVKGLPSIFLKPCRNTREPLSLFSIRPRSPARKGDCPWDDSTNCVHRFFYGYEASGARFSYNHYNSLVMV